MRLGDFGTIKKKNELDQIGRSASRTEERISFVDRSSATGLRAGKRTYGLLAAEKSQPELGVTNLTGLRILHTQVSSFLPTRRAVERESFHPERRQARSLSLIL